MVHKVMMMMIIPVARSKGVIKGAGTIHQRMNINLGRRICPVAGITEARPGESQVIHGNPRWMCRHQWVRNPPLAGEETVARDR